MDRAKKMGELFMLKKIGERRSQNEKKDKRSAELVLANEKLVKTQKELIEKENLMIAQSHNASMREMISMIAHRWRQPLNTLSLVLVDIKMAYLFHKLDEANFDESAEKADKLIQKMSATIDDFRNFFEPNNEKKSFTVSSAINDCLDLIENLLISNGVRVEKQLDETVSINGFNNELSQVFLNIINNSTDALTSNEVENKLIKIKMSAKNDKIIISISDNAGGIPENIMERIFDSYFTTKGEKNGTGLGLYMSKMIIEKHHDGKLSVENIDEGACFRLEIPIG
jgi:signal transduction histidine kinase